MPPNMSRTERNVREREKERKKEGRKREKNPFNNCEVMKTAGNKKEITWNKHNKRRNY